MADREARREVIYQAQEIIAEARILAEAHTELVLTGIHIGHYGHDLGRARTLSGLAALLILGAAFGCVGLERIGRAGRDGR